MIAEYDGDITSLLNYEPKGDLPILPTRNMVIFPSVIMPILIGRKSSIRLIEDLKESDDKIMAIFCQRNPAVENPAQDDLHEFGVYAKLVKELEIPGTDGHLTAIVQALGRCRLLNVTKRRPYMTGATELSPESTPAPTDKEFNTAIEDLYKSTTEYVHLNEDIPDESLFALNNI